MKIRSIHLTNFRKFVGTVAVDGITMASISLSARTRLASRRSWRRSTCDFREGEVAERACKKLPALCQRHSTEVELAFDLDGTRWTILKRFAGQSGKAV